MSVEVAYPAANQCIYCGATSYAVDSKRYLAEEHIIPFGLNGNVVIPRASCRRCERITGRTESIVLKGSLLGCRTHLRLQTRLPKDRPKVLPLFDPTTTPNRKVMVDIADYPISLLLMQLDQPAILTRRAADNSTSAVWSKLFRVDMETLRLKYGLSKIATSSLDVHSFNRMLAKIAHSFAMAEQLAGRLSQFKPYLVQLILDANGKTNWDMHVGGWLEAVPPSNKLHEIGIERPIERHEKLISVKIRLFANLGAPVYRVIAGERIA
ncbi:hypothetical protein [Afipia clevelandensis]|uniref:HNH endonuclease 5 domain-containing protein n=1 Tax=Afipia clevelandensis ATCC 49720 TaxID=883079 RepID=K8PK62_9BRAD|nr:hypothetical protein [Afipia clevelandensis]EKS38743.1 hypothetical protein HMPREF9696_01212 [Afipia clevelandensis ATCC 49720]